MRIQQLKLRPDAGRRLFPQVIDDLANEAPDRIIYEYAIGLKVEEGFKKVSCKDYANSINRVSWFLEEHFGRSQDGETIGYLGPGDLRYLILTVAAVKVGFKMLFVSPKNSLEGHLAVLEKAECNRWLIPSEGGNIDKILENRSMQTVQLPDLDALLDPKAVNIYPYEKVYEDAKDDPCWVLHTSGSTGLPKPVVRFMSSTASNESHLLCGPVDGRPLLIDETIGARIYMTFPLFHSAGLSNGLLWPIYCDQTVLLGPQTPMTTSVLNDMFDHAQVDVILTAPSTVEDISKSEATLNRLTKLKAVSFGGGPLSQEIGDMICAKTKLILIMGTSEAGWLTCVDTDREDWNYLHFHPNTGLELRKHPSGLYELYAVRKGELKQWQTVFTTFPDLQEYSFKDLFSKHPTKDNLWHYEGRADNIIVLSNGEKFNPTSMELTIGLHPIVKSVLIYGQARFQISALIELEGSSPANEEDKALILEQLRPSIEKANEEAPKHAKLSGDFIIFSKEDKPFLRAGKGTIQKQLTLNLYEEALESLYDQAGDSNTAKMDISSLTSIEEYVRELVQRDTGLKNISDHDDFFIGGADSLQAMTLLRHLRSSFDDDMAITQTLDVGLIYENPTILCLSTAIWNLKQKNTAGSSSKNMVEAMKLLLDKYAPSIQQVGNKPQSSNGNLVVLTGSTGSLGSYFLHQLMLRPDIKEIWCLNRSPDSEERQTKISKERGLEHDWKTYNVQFRQANLSKPMLGLEEQDYHYLGDHTSYIIHNQWQVDFNLSLSSFEPHIAGVSNLIHLSMESPNMIPIGFISSVGVAEYWSHLNLDSVAVPEDIISDFSAAAMGYGESKLIAEHLLAFAQEKGVPCTVFRVGQIAGPVSGGPGKGIWNRKEWLPTIVEASAYLNTLPSTLGGQSTITWIPVELVSRMILELSLDLPPESSNIRVFHITNPRKGFWADLCLAIQERLGQAHGKMPMLVSWDQWLTTLQAASKTGLNSAVIPGTKLLPFFENMGRAGKIEKEFDTKKAQQASSTMKGLQAVGPDWMQVWMEQWGY